MGCWAGKPHIFTTGVLTLNSFSLWKNWPFLPAPRILRQDERPRYLSSSVCLFSYPAENKKNVHPVGFQTGVKNSKLVLSDQNQVIMFLSSSLWVFPFCLVFLLCLHVCICPAATRLAPWEHHFDSTTTLCSCLSVLWSVARKGNFLFWHRAPFCLDLMCLCSNTSSG